MKLSDHFGTGATDDQGTPLYDLKDSLSGFGSHGFGELSVEQVVSNIKSPCKSGGVFSALFTGLLSLVSAPLAPLGTLLGLGLCSLLSTKEGREKMALDMYQALKISMLRDPSRFIALNIGTLDTVIEWYDKIGSENKLFKSEENPHPAYVPYNSPQYPAGTNVFSLWGPGSSYNRPGGGDGHFTNSALFSEAYSPTGSGIGWENLIDPKSPEADEMLKVFCKAYVLAQAFYPCAKNGSNMPLTFAYIYAVFNYQLKIHNLLAIRDTAKTWLKQQTPLIWNGNPGQEVSGTNTVGYPSGWVSFFLDLDFLDKKINENFAKEQEDYFKSYSAGEDEPEKAECKSIPDQSQKWVKDMAGIEELFAISKMAIEHLALKEAQKRDPSQYSSILAQNPAVSQYIKDQQYNSLFGSKKSVMGILIGLGGLIGLAIVAKGAKK